MGQKATTCRTPGTPQHRATGGKNASRRAAIFAAEHAEKEIAELHIYAGSGHGFGLRANDTKPVVKWVERLEEWLADSGFLKTL